MCAAWCRHYNHTQVLEGLAAEAEEFLFVEWLWGGLYRAAPVAGLRIYPHLSHAAPAVRNVPNNNSQDQEEYKSIKPYSYLLQDFFSHYVSYLYIIICLDSARVKLQKQ